MLIQTLMLPMARWLGSLLLGGVILWQVVEHTGSTKGCAIVHVPNVGVEVEVDDARYRIETLWETPVVCELTPGGHTLRLIREGRVVCEEEFAVGRGEEIIVSAWDKTDGNQDSNHDNIEYNMCHIRLGGESDFGPRKPRNPGSATAVLPEVGVHP